ncbi:histone family protein DNA-binding protein [Naviculisporaceae sp. PSN 640]
MGDQDKEEELRMEDLAAEMAMKSGLSQNDAEAALEAIILTMSDATERNDPVVIGDTIWEVRERQPAKKAVNPRTKEPIDIPKAKVPLFRSGKLSKDGKNGGSSR